MVRMLGEMNWELTSESEGGSYSPVDVGSPHPRSLSREQGLQGSSSIVALAVIFPDRIHARRPGFTLRHGGRPRVQGGSGG